MTAEDELRGRLAKSLKWELRDVQGLPLQILRDIVRKPDPKLAREITRFLLAKSRK